MQGMKTEIPTWPVIVNLECHRKDRPLSFLFIYTFTLLSLSFLGQGSPHVHGGHSSTTAPPHDPNCSSQGVHLTLTFL